MRTVVPAQNAWSTRCRIETGHRAAVEPEQAGRHHQVGALAGCCCATPSRPPRRACPRNSSAHRSCARTASASDRESARSCPMMATTGASVVLATLPGLTQASSCSFADGVTTNCTRIGWLFIEVGAYLANSYTSRNKASGTGRASQRLHERASLKTRRAVASVSIMVMVTAGCYFLAIIWITNNIIVYCFPAVDLSNHQETHHATTTHSSDPRRRFDRSRAASLRTNLSPPPLAPVVPFPPGRPTNAVARLYAQAMRKHTGQRIRQTRAVAQQPLQAGAVQRLDADAGVHGETAANPTLTTRCPGSIPIGSICAAWPRRRPSRLQPAALPPDPVQAPLTHA